MKLIDAILALAVVFAVAIVIAAVQNVQTVDAGIAAMYHCQFENCYEINNTIFYFTK